MSAVARIAAAQRAARTNPAATAARVASAARTRAVRLILDDADVRPYAITSPAGGPTRVLLRAGAPGVETSLAATRRALERAGYLVDVRPPERTTATIALVVEPGPRFDERTAAERRASGDASRAAQQYRQAHR